MTSETVPVYPVCTSPDMRMARNTAANTNPSRAADRIEASCQAQRSGMRAIRARGPRSAGG
jgi:hypothetical protein